MVRVLTVLIPFLSGLHFQQEALKKEHPPSVLIPFLSGLHFQPNMTDIEQAYRLNPFSIRSPLPTEKPVEPLQAA